MTNERPYWCPMPNHGHHDAEGCPKCAAHETQKPDEWITRDLAQWETYVNTSDLRDLLNRARTEINRYRGVKTERVPRCYEVPTRDRPAPEPSVEQFEVKMKAAREANGLRLLRVACTCPSDTELDPRCFVAFPHPWHAVKSPAASCEHEWTYTENKDVGWCVKCRAERTNNEQSS